MAADASFFGCADSLVLTRYADGVQVGDPITLVEGGIATNPGIDFAVSDIDITGVDSFILVDTSYIEGGYSRTYSFELDREGSAREVAALIEALPAVDAPQPVKSGNTVTVKFVASLPNPLSGMRGTISCDKDALELTSISAGEGHAMDESAHFETTVGTGFFSFYGNEAPATSGLEILSATFVAKGQADAATISLANGTIISATGDPMTEFTPAVTASDPMVIIAAVQKGDVNCNGNINIVDAQIAYDISASKYAQDGDELAKLVIPGLSKATITWAALVNDDDFIDAADAFAIQWYVHYGSFGK